MSAVVQGQSAGRGEGNEGWAGWKAYDWIDTEARGSLPLTEYLLSTRPGPSTSHHRRDSRLESLGDKEFPG